MCLAILEGVQIVQRVEKLQDDVPQLHSTSLQTHITVEYLRPCPPCNSQKMDLHISEKQKEASGTCFFQNHINFSEHKNSYQSIFRISMFKQVHHVSMAMFNCVDLLEGMFVGL